MFKKYTPDEINKQTTVNHKTEHVHINQRYTGCQHRTLNTTLNTPYTAQSHHTWHAGCGAPPPTVLRCPTQKTHAFVACRFSYAHGIAIHSNILELAALPTNTYIITNFS